MSIYNFTEREKEALARSRESNPFNLNKSKHWAISRDDLVAAFLQLGLAPSRSNKGQLSSKKRALYFLQSCEEKVEIFTSLLNILNFPELNKPDDLFYSQTREHSIKEITKMLSEAEKESIIKYDFILLYDLEKEINNIISDAIDRGALSAIYLDGAKTKRECLLKQINKIKGVLENVNKDLVIDHIISISRELYFSYLENSFRIIDVINWVDGEKLFSSNFPLQLPNEFVAQAKEFAAQASASVPVPVVVAQASTKKLPANKNKFLKDCDRFIRIRDVVALTTLSSWTIRKKVLMGEFPKPEVLGPRTSLWRLNEIKQFIAK